MLKKLIAPVVIGGVLLGGAVAGGTAYAGTPTPTTAATAAPAAHPHARAWLKAHRKGLRKAGIAISAKTIGVTPQALVTELKSGKSIAQVAGEHSVTAQAVVDAIDSAADAKVAQAVTDKSLTQAQADKIEAALPARVTKLVNHVFGTVG
jgi:uncharacterized membrane protein